MFLTYFLYSITPNQTLAFVHMMVFHYIQNCEDTWWKNLEKTQLGAETIWAPVTELAVGNQPPLSVAFRYCNRIRAVHEVMVP